MTTIVKKFSATWCGPCRMLAPMMEMLSQGGYKVDLCLL